MQSTTIAPLTWCETDEERAAATALYETELAAIRARYAPLTGSEKQIAWATTIRDEITSTLADLLARTQTFSATDTARLARMRERLAGAALESPSAAWWIGQRDNVSRLRDTLTNARFEQLTVERWTEGY